MSLQESASFRAAMLGLPLSGLRFPQATAVVVFTAIVCFIAGAADAPPQTDELDFLQPGTDYLIRFPQGNNPFTSTSSGVTSVSFTTEDGETEGERPATWSATLTLEVFRVVRRSRGSWVLLEHPTNPDDFAKWSSKRRAMAILADPRTKEAPQFRQQLKALHEDAGTEISTSEIWINLDHAVAISPVRAKDFEGKLAGATETDK